MWLLLMCFRSSLLSVRPVGACGWSVSMMVRQGCRLVRSLVDFRVFAACSSIWSLAVMPGSGRTRCRGACTLAAREAGEAGVGWP